MRLSLASKAGSPNDVTPEQIEADITAAREEVREARRGRGWPRCCTPPSIPT